MPIYVYRCGKCNGVVEQTRSVSERDAEVECPCGGPLVRDLRATLLAGTPRSGELPDWTSVNAGFSPYARERAEREYADLGVRIDRKGNVTVPGRNRKAFLKRRGMTELDGAPKIPGATKRFFARKS